MVSSFSSSVYSPPQHQVFINFRGKQLRNNFVSHLEKALRRDGINVFIDNNETKGKDLSILFSRIEQSRIALAIFSSLYTESKWCLDELDKIKECVDLGKLVVIPIFYKVETDDVKNLKGVFGDKFWELAKTCKGEKLDKWKQALEAVPQKLGFTLTELSDEGEYITKIVGEVMKVLTDVSMHLERQVPIQHPFARQGETHEAAPDSPPPLYGIETRLKQLEDKVDFEYENTLTIGVVGMPGIGKTTLAKMLYEKWQHKFLRCVFLHDVRKMWIDGIIDRCILMKELLRDENVNQNISDLSPESLKALLLSKKSLVVLDDVSDKKQINVLLEECDWIKRGSRIIITTSDRSVIQEMVDDTYEVLRLTGRDSFQFFSYFAFSGKLPTPEGNFMNLSRMFADYAKGNPLALKVLGIELYEKDETHWEEQLCKLGQSPNKTIQDVLQISYDRLGQLQKDVFLDVACFFRSGDEYYVRCLVDSCDTEPIDVVRDLASKFLINISGGRVEMHDLLYTFGKELGSQGLCRLWNHKDVVGVLKKRAGADSVRGIFLDMSELKNELPLDISTFTVMRNLRYLKFYSSRCHRECEAECKLNFPEGLEFPIDEVRYLYWLKFPLKKLPKDFNPKNLTDLNLPYSEIEEVWEGVKDTPKLKWVDLSHSSKLCNLSGLLNAESLQRLNLEGCTGLEELPREMKRMKSLVFLNMRGCTTLRVLPRMSLISLKTLILANCSSLKEFQVISEKLEALNLDGTAITQLPINMVKLQRLIVLNLKDCKMLRAIPECLGKLKSLQELVLSGCSKLETFPIPIENMKCLQILLLDGTAIKEMPNISPFNSSKVEDLRKLRCGMNGLSSLRRLSLSRNDMISNLQIDISQLSHLKWFDLKYCTNLTSIPLLPPNLEILDAHGCDKLKTVASPMALLKHMEKVQCKFIFTNCNNLEQVAKNSITSYAQKKIQLEALSCYKEGNVSKALLITCFPGRKVPSWFNNQSVGSALKLKFPPHWCDNRLSTIVLCAVVTFPNPQDEINRFSIECTCEFKNELGTCIRFSCILGGGVIEPRKIDSDHVFIGYTSSSHITNHLEESSKLREQHKCVPTEASIKFEVRGGAGEIMNCGLSLVYEEPNDVVGTSSRRDMSAGESKLSLAAGFFSEDTPKLKWVDLNHASKLRNLSGLLNAESLQRLNLEGCTSLEELPHEMERMKSLIFLNMRGCTSLRVLPHMNLISMKTLILTNCTSLQEFQVISGNLETLHLDGTAIGQLPTEMVKLERLIVLNLKDCKMLRAVPECLGKLKALQELVLSGCSKLETFPISIVNMKCLQILLLDGTSIKQMPKILQLNCSKVEDQRKLRRGMDGLSTLRRLCLSRNDMIINLETNIIQLDHLKWLDLKYCKNLTSISLLLPNLEILDAHGCDKLKVVEVALPIPLMEQVQSKLIFTNCNNLEQDAKNSITTYAQRKIQLDTLRCYKEGTVSEALLITCFPGSEVPSWFNHQTFGSELNLKFPPHWCDDRLSAIVLCAVVTFPNTQDKINRFSIECTCEFKNTFETCLRFSCTLGGGWIEPRKIDSDHVFIGYTSSSHITKHLERSMKSQEHHRCVPTEASIKFEVRDGAGEIVNCGLSLVYEKPNHVVVEGNCNGTSSRRDLSVGESILSFAAGFLPDVLRFLWLCVVFFMVYGFARFFVR